MKLAAWARADGIHPQTALRWWREGTLPVPARKVGPRTILVDPAPAAGAPSGALDARVASHDQRADLDRQLGRLVAWASAHDLAVAHAVTEVGSGMTGARPKLRRLLADPTVTTFVVEHRDRRARLGSEDIEAALLGAGRRLVVVNPPEVTDDLGRDLTDGVTTLCARLDGRRSARTRAHRALRGAAQPVEVA